MLQRSHKSQLPTGARGRANPGNAAPGYHSSLGDLSCLGRPRGLYGNNQDGPSCGEVLADGTGWVSPVYGFHNVGDDQTAWGTFSGPSLKTFRQMRPVA